MVKKIEGHYIAFYKGFTSQYIGGCIYWNQDKHDPNQFWTSRWWLYENHLDIVADFYKVKEDDDLELVFSRKKIRIEFPGNIILGQMLKGSMKIVLL